MFRGRERETQDEYFQFHVPEVQQMETHSSSVQAKHLLSTRTTDISAFMCQNIYSSSAKITHKKSKNEEKRLETRSVQYDDCDAEKHQRHFIISGSQVSDTHRFSLIPLIPDDQPLWALFSGQCLNWMLILRCVNISLDCVIQHTHTLPVRVC